MPRVNLAAICAGLALLMSSTPFGGAEARHGWHGGGGLFSLPLFGGVEARHDWPWNQSREFGGASINNPNSRQGRHPFEPSGPTGIDNPT